ncbi:hypothetical protein O6H91_02G077600 [Diphasiastrum complanatum]|uniref:Uncharacterized protein n=1 Tax=Diphasiastrum complanatum TaxID=34168 RepID=A0ACC2EHE1_DIPCM|nr:hypothetical protein O6H91_02G077600 [Diphasiastrum complanatum]
MERSSDSMLLNSKALFVLLLITRLTSATIYPLNADWMVVNDDNLGTSVKNGDINRIVFLDTESEFFALVFLSTSGANSFYGPDVKFILTVVTHPYGDPTTWIPVWSANRDRPVGQNASLHLDRGSRNLILRDVDGSLVWTSVTPSKATIASAGIDSYGNFVLYDSSNQSVWESFHSPTDTLLPRQSLLPGFLLRSALSNSWASRSANNTLAAESSGLAFLIAGEVHWTISLLQSSNHCDISAVSHTCSHFTYALYDLSRGLTLQADFSTTHKPAEHSSFCSRTLATNTTVTVLPSSSQPNGTHQFIRLDSDGALRLYGYDIDSRAWQVEQILPLANNTCRA